MSAGARNGSEHSPAPNASSGRARARPQRAADVRQRAVALLAVAEGQSREAAARRAGYARDTR